MNLWNSKIHARKGRNHFSSLFWEILAQHLCRSFFHRKKWDWHSLYSPKFEYLQVDVNRLALTQTHIQINEKQRNGACIVRYMCARMCVFAWACDWKEEWTGRAKASYELLPLKIKEKRIANQWCHLKFSVLTSNAVTSFCSYNTFHVFFFFFS